jgi:ATP-dependent Clp protease ATP-binding subunit ClpA
MDEVREIAILYSSKLQRQMEKQGKTLDISSRAIDLLTEKGFSPAYGARFLKRHIDEKVKLPITAQWKDAARFLVDAVSGEITIAPADSGVVVSGLN